MENRWNVEKIYKERWTVGTEGRKEKEAESGRTGLYLQEQSSLGDGISFYPFSSTRKSTIIVCSAILKIQLPSRFRHSESPPLGLVNG